MIAQKSVSNLARKWSSKMIVLQKFFEQKTVFGTENDRFVNCSTKNKHAAKRVAVSLRSTFSMTLIVNSAFPSLSKHKCYFLSSAFIPWCWGISLLFQMRFSVEKRSKTVPTERSESGCRILVKKTKWSLKMIFFKSVFILIRKNDRKMMFRKNDLFQKNLAKKP